MAKVCQKTIGKKYPLKFKLGKIENKEKKPQVFKNVPWQPDIPNKSIAKIPKYQNKNNESYFPKFVSVTLSRSP